MSTSFLPTDVKEVGGGKAEEADRKPTKDDAYSQFMREMEGLLWGGQRMGPPVHPSKPPCNASLVCIV